MLAPNEVVLCFFIPPRILHPEDTPGAGLRMFWMSVTAPGSRLTNGVVLSRDLVSGMLLLMIGEVLGNSASSCAMAGIAISNRKTSSFFIMVFFVPVGHYLALALER